MTYQAPPKALQRSKSELWNTPYMWKGKAAKVYAIVATRIKPCNCVLIVHM